MKYTIYYFLFASNVLFNYVWADQFNYQNNTFRETVNLNRDIYVSNAIARSNSSDEVDSYAYPGYAREFVKSYKKIKRENPDILPKKLNQLTLAHLHNVKEATKAILNHQNDVLDDTSTEILYSAAAIIRAMPGRGSIIGSSISEATKWGTRLANHLWGDENQASSMLDINVQMGINFNLGQTYFENMWKLSHQYPEAGKAVDSFFANIFKARVNDSAQEIINRNFELKTDSHLKKALSLISDNAKVSDLENVKSLFIDKLSLLNKDIEKAGEKFTGMLRNQMNNNSNLQVSLLKDIQKYVVDDESSIHNMVTSIQQEQIEQARQEYNYSAAYQSIYSLGAILSFIGDRTENKEMVEFSIRATSVANSMVNIHKSLSNFSNISSIAGENVAIAITTGNLLSAGLSIISVFGKGGPNQGLMVQIQELGKQIYHLRHEVQQLRQQMHERFDNISSQISLLYGDMQQGFDLLQKQLNKQRYSQLINHNEISRDMSMFLQKFESLNQILNDLNTTIIAVEDQRLLYSLRQTIDKCHNYDIRYPGKKLTIDEFTACLEKLQFLALRSESFLAHTDDDYIKLSSVLNGRNIFRQQEYILQHFYGIKTNNMMIWSLASQTYFDLILKYPEYSNIISSFDIESLISQEKFLANQFDLLFSDRIEHYQAMQKFYYQTLENLKESIRTIMNNYIMSHEKFISIDNKFDLFKGEGQKTSYIGNYSKQIPHCQNPSKQKLQGFKEDFYFSIIPSYLRIIMGMNNAKIRSCYIYHFNNVTNKLHLSINFDLVGDSHIHNYATFNIVSLHIKEGNSLSGRLKYEWAELVNEVNEMSGKIHFYKERNNDLWYKFEKSKIKISWKQKNNFFKRARKSLRDLILKERELLYDQISEVLCNGNDNSLTSTSDINDLKLSFNNINAVTNVMKILLNIIYPDYYISIQFPDQVYLKSHICTGKFDYSLKYLYRWIKAGFPPSFESKQKYNELFTNLNEFLKSNTKNSESGSIEKMSNILLDNI